MNKIVEKLVGGDGDGGSKWCIFESQGTGLSVY